MPPPPADVTTAALFKETISLHQELTNGLTGAGIDRWIGDSNARQMLLQNTVWGRIRWPKTLGRPLTASLADGFAVIHQYYYFTFTGGQDGSILPGTSWATGSVPMKWDAPEEPDDYVVGYFAYGVPLWTNRIVVALVTGASWQYRPAIEPGYRHIEPPAGEQYFKAFGPRVTLDDFSVKFVPYEP